MDKLTLANTCRVCLSSERVTICLRTPITAPHLNTGIPPTHLECLRRCTTLSYPSTVDNFVYPMRICLRCSKSLQVAYYFQEMAKESEEVLFAQAQHDASNKKNVHVHLEKDLEEPELTATKTKDEQAVTSTVTDSGDAQLHCDDEFLKYKKDFVEHVVQKNTVRKLEQATMASIASSVWSPDLKHMQFNAQFQQFVKKVNANKTTEEPNKRAPKRRRSSKTSQPTTKVCKQHIEIEETPPDTVQEIVEITIEQQLGDLLDEGVEEHLIENDKENYENDTWMFEEDHADSSGNVEQHEVEDSSHLVCKICKSSFNNMPAFLKHRDQHKGIAPLYCNNCDFSTGYETSLRKHYAKSHEIKATNEMIEKATKPRGALNNTPYREITFQCNICDCQKFNENNMSEHILHKHQITENIETSFTPVFNCPDCARIFKSQKGMHTHFTLTHGDSKDTKKLSTDIYVCEYCGQEFPFKSSLLTHQQHQHIDVNCTLCTQKFKTVRRFEQHLHAEHNVVCIHECEICGKNFHNADYLRRHRKRHTERHFQCQHCSLTYINAGELKCHMLSKHASATEQQATCHSCNIKFRNLTELRKHELQLHRSKLFKCLHCDFQSKSRGSTRMHQIIWHTGKPYKCDICAKEFAARVLLRRHARTLHGIELTEQQLGDIFRRKYGYLSRYDAFSKDTLVLTDVNEPDVEAEDIVKDPLASSKEAIFV